MCQGSWCMAHRSLSLSRTLRRWKKGEGRGRDPTTLAAPWLPDEIRLHPLTCLDRILSPWQLYFNQSKCFRYNTTVSICRWRSVWYLVICSYQVILQRITMLMHLLSMCFACYDRFSILLLAKCIWQFMLTVLTVSHAFEIKYEREQGWRQGLWHTQNTLCQNYLFMPNHWGGGQLHTVPPPDAALSHVPLAKLSNHFHPPPPFPSLQPYSILELYVHACISSPHPHSPSTIFVRLMANSKGWNFSEALHHRSNVWNLTQQVLTTCKNTLSFVFHTSHSGGYNYFIISRAFYLFSIRK